jgi:hypothetical protein
MEPDKIGLRGACARLQQGPGPGAQKALQGVCRKHFHDIILTDQTSERDVLRNLHGQGVPGVCGDQEGAPAPVPERSFKKCGVAINCPAAHPGAEQRTEPVPTPLTLP